MKTTARTTWTENGVAHINDIRMIDGTIAEVADLEAYAQAIEAAVLTVRGELQLDMNRGVPYFTTVFDSNRGIEGWAAAVRQTVSALSFVESIRSFVYSLDPSRSTLSYVLNVETDLGETTVSSAVSPTA